MRNHRRFLPKEYTVHERMGILKLNTKQDLQYDVLKNSNPAHCHTVTTLCGRVLTAAGHSHGESVYKLVDQIIQVRGENLILPAEKVSDSGSPSQPVTR